MLAYKVPSYLDKDKEFLQRLFSIVVHRANVSEHTDARIFLMGYATSIEDAYKFKFGEDIYGIH